jgi:multiple sugar transport system substrate-binding protein/raffinose/stachyose/melibiose transport system substrate-binding protein
MTFQGSWAAGTLLRDKKFQSGIFMPPWNDAGRQPVPVIGSETGFAVGETRNKQAALLFLDFLYGPGFVIEQNKRQNIPPLKQLAGPAVVDQQIFDYVSRLENTEVSAGPYYSYLPSGTIDLLHPLLQDVLFGKKSPQQAAQILNQSLRDQAHTNNK